MSESRRPKPPASLRAILPVALIALYLPLVVMVAGSFLDLGGRESGLTSRWYEEVFNDPELWASLGRSLLVALGTAIVSTFFGLLGALALDRWDFWGKRSLQTLSLVSLMLPELVLALSLLSWFSVLKLELSLVTVTIAHVTLTLPFVILVIGARLKGLDRSFDDAAKDLGATDVEVLKRVTLPLLKPSIVTAFLLAFLLSFDDFLVTFYTNGAGADTLPVRLYSLMKTGLSPKIQALSSIMLLVSIGLVVLLVKLRGIDDLMETEER